MASRISVLTFLVVAALIIYYATVLIPTITATFADENPIRVASDDIDDDDAVSSASISPSFTVEAIYQFGDSLSDTGNFIRENPKSKFAKLPYGQTFFHKPTGRCSDGLLMIDHITKFFNLPFLDPYLNKDGNFSHGINFAVAGSTALNISTLAMKDIVYCPTTSSLLVQLDWFKAHLNSICSNASECKQKLAKALIMMGEIGGNDYNWAFFQGNPITEIYEMVPEVIQVIKTAIKEVINFGAIRVVVPGNFPLGCTPIYLKMFKTNDSEMYDELQCLKSLNTFATFHNNKLQEAIEEIRKDHPDVSIGYADYFSAYKEILQHATSLGFDKDMMQTTCCGICNKHPSNLDSGIKCASKGVACEDPFSNGLCEDPYKHMNWDGIHLTQHAYHIMAKLLIKRINFLGISHTI